MDGGNAENAGAFFGPGGRRSLQSDTTTPPNICASPNKKQEDRDKLRIHGISFDIYIFTLSMAKGLENTDFKPALRWHSGLRRADGIGSV
ncbi:hypothetical protein LH51_11030 [Nitrincola sp. A-D6]|uniref:hypothetical protein n=1 Tax=Nitrincola sp. A-D6 TaxID=1545442 RepID=UPI00051FAFAA|nr:hypothetical protein [Nitrincola sp. A-D6]KGK41897.1 hypothetical protein LH51_11030 [Nitrincola sp. A-D6]